MSELWDTVGEFADECRQLRQRIKELESQLAAAQQWEPVPDGEYGKHDTITLSHSGRIVSINSKYGDGSISHSAMLPLPEGWALHRRTTTPQEGE